MTGGQVGFFALLVVCAAMSGYGDIAIFQWAKGQAAWGLVGGIAIWVASLVLLAYLFRLSVLPFSVVIVLILVIHLLFDVAWDVAVFGSRLSVWQWLGVALAGAAVVLLQIGRNAD